MVWKYDNPRWQRVHGSIVVLMSMLFVESVLEWRGVDMFGIGPQFRPLSSVFLTGALLLQALAGFLCLRKWYKVSITIALVSLVGIWLSIRTQA